jgi:glycosyltransferase involved in cell wall biosynthesis
VTRACALVAARDEGERIAATVTALRSLGGVERVIVVDDGSTDGTASRARAAGAVVLRHARSVGKGGALEAALTRLPRSDVWLLADGDLGDSAGALAPLLELVRRGDADVGVAAFPAPADGGFGLVKASARTAIRLLAGLDVTEPLSGQRALTAAAMEVVRPLAGGYALETAMTIDAARAGLRVLEVPLRLTHRPTFRDVHGFAHRGRQGLDILAAVAARALGPR